MTSTRHQAKLNILQGIADLEEIDLVAGSRPPDNFIISRNHESEVASVYGEIRWDISTWHPEGRLAALNFNFWPKGDLTPIREQLSRDARWLMFCLIWIGEDRPLSVASLQGFLTLIRGLSLTAEESSCLLPDLLSNEKRLLVFLDAPGTKRWSSLQTLCSLISRLSRIDEGQLGFGVIGDRARKVLSARSADVKKQQKQTPPIPSAIYSSILSSLMGELDDWQLVASECLKLLEDCGKDPCYGRHDRVQRIWFARGAFGNFNPLPQWEDVASFRLREYLRSKGVPDNVVGLGNIVVEVQAVTKLIIQAFTGMRDNEALCLPYDCLITNMLGGRKHRLVQGYTTKLSKSLKAVRWVTNEAGQRAVEIAQKIAAAIYAACGASVEVDKRPGRKMNSRPLFVSLAYTYACSSRRRFNLKDHFFPVDLGLHKFDRLLSRVLPVIREEHLVELEQIDEHRAWRSETKFRLGSPWPLRTHQFRRSLALYAQRSGLVTLPSLRRQLQHLTDEMSRYYSRGSEYAKDIFADSQSDSQHFCFEWQNTRAESEAISYVKNVLLSDQKLFGGHAAFVAQRFYAVDQVLTHRARAETVRMFKNGQLHYRETLLGGCVRQDECERPALDWMNLECISNNCGNMIGNLAKLEAAVKEQTNLVRSLSIASLLYRTEKTNLDVLVGALERARDVKKDTK